MTKSKRVLVRCPHCKYEMSLKVNGASEVRSCPRCSKSVSVDELLKHQVPTAPPKKKEGPKE